MGPSPILSIIHTVSLATLLNSNDGNKVTMDTDLYNVNKPLMPHN